MRTTRFVILGDTHFCADGVRQQYDGKCLLAEKPDYVRYSPMRTSVLEPMFARIRALAPDFVVSSGDFVEGGMADHGKTLREMREGWTFMRSLQCPVLIAKGTHEGSGSHPGAQIYREIVLPGMSEMTGTTIEKEYFLFERDGNAFLILDYLDYHAGGEQDTWLENNLRDLSSKARRIFIVAHPPLFNWGRHYFNEIQFITRLIQLCGSYPVDAYISGHTHNQTLSFHEVGEGKGFLQITGSSVGYPDMNVRALDEFHALAEFTPNDHFLWGIHEDSSPGFHLVELEDSAMTVRWNSFKGDQASAVISKRRSAPCEISPPTYITYEKRMRDMDMDQIKSGVLYVYGIYGNKNTEVLINGISLGALPPNTSYAARRFLTLHAEAMRSIVRDNRITIKLPENSDFVVGSLSLEFLLFDNRMIHSAVGPELFIHGSKWKDFPSTRPTTMTEKGQTVTTSIQL